MKNNDPVVEPDSHLNVIPSLPQLLMTAKQSSKTALPNHVVVVEQPNPYLLLRESKIARNKERLVKLGLSHGRNSKSFIVEKGNAQCTSVKTAPASTVLIVPCTRRSSRLRIRSVGASGAQGKSADGVSATSIGTDNVIDSNSRGGRILKLRSNDTKKIAQKRRREYPFASQQPPLVRQIEPGFTRSTTIDIHTVLFGHPRYTNNEDMYNPKKIHRMGMIGRRLETAGKAIVVNSSAKLSKAFSNDSSSSIGTMLRFNKYSGICEWENDVIFLWVNIGAPESVVVNNFLQGGRQITWFGGSRMNENTPAIKNLLRIGKMIASSHRECNSVITPARICGGGIVLWCRMYDSEKRTFLPYTCLGRVGYRSHDPDVHPIQFVWDLLDYEKLMAVEVAVDVNEDGVDDLGRKNAFQKIIMSTDR